MTTRVYRYGLLAPTENGDLVRQQMRLGHRYQNDLIAIERGRRLAFAAVMSSDTRIAEAEAKITEIEAKITEAVERARQARVARRSKADTDETKAEIRALKASKAAAVLELRAIKPLVQSDLRPRIAEVDARAHELQISARAHCGVYWGTYLLAEAAAEQAAKTTKGELKFQRWDGSGQVSVQLQGGADIDDVVGDSDTRIRWPEYVEGTRKAKRTELVMRVSSDKGAPVWARWPMVYHRPLPTNARIKRVIVSLRMRGPREEWSVEVTIDASTCRLRDRPDGGKVAVHLGWRKEASGNVRVATWLGDDGDTGTIECPERVLTGLEKSESLRSIRDRNLDELRARLVSARDGWPEWLRDATSSLHQWRSPGRFVALAQRWKAAGVAPEHASDYGAIEAWRYNDHHLWRWEHDQRLNSTRYRREVYRIAVAALSKRYRRAILMEAEWAEMAKLPGIGEGAPDLPDEARAQRVETAPYVLTEALHSAMTEVVWVDPSYLSQACRHCDHKDTGDTWVRECTSCGKARDIDQAAVRTMLDLEEAGAWSWKKGGAKDDSGKVREIRAPKWAKKHAIEAAE